MFEQRMSMLTLGVADVGRAKAFYEALGWAASSASQGEVAFFQIGGSVLALYAQANLSADLKLAGNPRAGGVTLAYNTRSREEVDALMDEAVSAGAAVLVPAHETSWGGYVGYIADPDGHPWEIACVNMFMPAADGSIHLP